MWIPIDTRLIDHPKVRRIQRCLRCSLPEVVGGLVVLWGIAADLDTERFDGTPDALWKDYGLPNGLIEAMEAVGWARIEADHVVVSTRNQDRESAASKRRQNAQHAARMRWMRQHPEHMRPHGEHMRQHDAADATAYAAMPQRKRQRKKETYRASAASRPAALVEQAGDAAGVGTPAQALRLAIESLGKAQ